MYNLYDKFLSDSLTPEEEEDLQFLLKDKKNKKAFEAYLRDLRDTYAALQEPSSINAYYKINTVLGLPKNQPTKISNINWFKLVAAVLIYLSISYGGYYITTKQSETPVINTAPLITLELEDGSIKTLNEINSDIITDSKGKKVGTQEQNLLLYFNEGHYEEEKLIYNKLTIPYGKKFQIVLSDGTHVFLNAGSSLRYPIKFLNKFNRDVYLDGEAYFEVKKDAVHPFTVITEKMNTRVLGTKFNVSSYKNEDNTSSVLVSGAIDVYNASENYNPNKTIRIKPGQRAHFEENNINVEQVNILKYTAWTEGKLFFVEDRFDLILKKLERHFNVSINNTYTALNKEFLTGTFETENLNQILKTFQTYTPFNYTIKGTTITITK